MGVALDARALLAVDVLLLGMDLEPGELTAVQVRGLPASLRTCVPAYLRTYLPTYLPTYQAWVRRGGALIVSVPHPAEPEEPPERQVLRSPALARSQPDPPPHPPLCQTLHPHACLHAYMYLIKFRWAFNDGPDLMPNTSALI